MVIVSKDFGVFVNPVFQRPHFSGLYYIKTQPDKDWVKNFAEVSKDAGGGIKLNTVTAAEMFPDDMFVRKTHQFSVYTAIDNETVLVKTPVYVDVEVETSLLATMLKKMGMDDTVAEKIKNIVPEMLSVFKTDELTLITDILDFPVVTTPERFYEAMKDSIENRKYPEEALVDVLKSHPFNDKIPDAERYKDLLRMASENGYSDLMRVLYAIRKETFPAHPLKIDSYAKTVIGRGNVEEVERLEKTIRATGMSEIDAKTMIMTTAMKQGQHEVFHHFYELLGKPEADDDMFKTTSVGSTIEYGEFKSLLANADFEVSKYYIEFFKLLDEIKPSVLTLQAVKRLLKGDDQLMQYLQDNKTLQLKYWPWVLLNNNSLSDFEKNVKLLMGWGFDPNQPPSKANGNRVFPFIFVSKIGSLYGEALRSGLSTLKDDKTRLKAFKYFSIMKNLGVDLTIQDKNDQYIWDALSMTKQEFFDVVDSDLVRNYKE